MKARHGAPARLALAIAGVLILHVAPSAQDPTPFRAGTTLVPVDVRVVDRDGRPVTDLAASDFTILEDGVPQPIAHFASQTFTPEPAAADAAAFRPPGDGLAFAPNRRRTVLIVLGRGRLQPPSQGVDAMLHLVRDRLLPQDQVAVLAWNRATEFSTDRHAAIEVLERFKREHEGIETRIVLWERSLQSFFSGGELPADIQRDIDGVFGGGRSARTTPEVVPEAATAALRRPRPSDTLPIRPIDSSDRASDRGTLEPPGGRLDDFLDQSTAIFHDVTALFLGVEYLRRLPGEKHLVFLSEFGISLRGLDGDRALGRRAADARVVLDIIHAGGVPFGMSDGVNVPPPGLGMPQAMTARDLASLTGGSFFNHRFPNASMDVDAIDAATRFEYVLGYYPSNAKWDGKYRRIDIKVNRRGLTVLHRDGYFARRETTQPEPRNLLVYSEMVGVAAGGTTARDLGVTARRAVAAMNGTAGQVQVDMTIDLSHVAFEPRDGRQHGLLEIAVFCDGRDESAGQSWQTLELTYSDETLAELRRTGLDHTTTISVTSMPETARIVVYDYGSNRLGAQLIHVTRAKQP